MCGICGWISGTPLDPGQVEKVRNSQQVAFQVATYATMLPSFVLSGFVFPLSSMPWVVQGLSYLFPARYFVTILRGIYLKDVGLAVLWPEVLFLGAFGIIVLVLAVKKFRKKIL